MKGEKRNIQIINNYQKTFMIELKGKQDSCIGTTNDILGTEHLHQKNIFT